MRMRSIGVALALVLAGGAAAGAAGSSATPAAVGGPTPSLSNGSVGVGGHTTGGPLNPAATATATGNKSVGTTPGNLPPPPPPTLTTPPALVGVPPTPAPAVAGLPTSSDSRALPSQTGLSARVENELRPAASLSAAQVADIQASLAAGGLYRGPINGVLSGSTRAAVREFQAIQRLPTTGELDAETLARLVNGRSPSTPANSGNGTLGGGVASGGTTSTAGTPNVVDPFTGGNTPFPLSAPLNMSASAPPGTVMQP